MGVQCWYAACLFRYHVTSSLFCFLYHVFTLTVGTNIFTSLLVGAIDSGKLFEATKL